MLTRDGRCHAGEDEREDGVHFALLVIEEGSSRRRRNADQWEDEEHGE